MVLAKMNWQSNGYNYVMRRFVICALTDDHVKDDEIGGVHSAHVTTKQKLPLERPKHTWKGNIKMNLNPLTSDDHYSGRTAPLTSKRCILYIY